MKAKFSFLFGIFSLISTTVFAAPQWTIAIDPGHGGKDPGAIGKNLGIYEKNVTLSTGVSQQYTDRWFPARSMEKRGPWLA